MKLNDGKTFSAHVRSKLHSGYITVKLVSVYCTETRPATDDEQGLQLS